MQLSDRKQAGNLLGLAELIVEEELCLNLRGRLMHCSACRDICPADALELTPDSVDVDETRCTGCNSCLPSCSAGALRSTAFLPERFLQALSASGLTDLHCRISEDGGGGVVIPCHTVLDARLLAAARGDGVTQLRLHGLNRCADCRHGDARAHIHSVIARLAQWLGEEAPSLDLDPPAVCDNASDRRDYQDQPHMDRRAFLRFGGAKGMTQAADWLLPGLSREEEDGEALPFYQTNGYAQRASAYQQALIARAEHVPWRASQPLPFMRRQVSEDCSACLSCAERCPTGALHASVSAQYRQLSFDPAVCTDCGLCERICPERAVLPEPLRDIKDLKAGRETLFSVSQQPCRQCGNPFLPMDTESDLCPVCNNEQELDEAWLEMLSG
ncbi:MAG: 4Fe-4S binding protein [Candidatus Thiodiazotropha sp.]